MKDIVISSSALIAALFLLRALFRNAVGKRVQYALWLIVLVRLLVPVTLPAFPLSVLNAERHVSAFSSAALTRGADTAPVTSGTNSAPSSPDAAPPSDAASSSDAASVSRAGNASAPAAPVSGGTAEKADVGSILKIVWICGMAAMSLWFAATNLRFWRHLRRHRTAYPAEGCAVPVYLCPGLPSPCLFGFLRPAIYLTPAAAESEETLRYVLAHEKTHYRHLDPLWSLLRGVCLAIYWFNPLVWAAAAASEADCELACDEAVIRSLGEEARIPYGRALISLIPVRSLPANPMLSATAMTAGRRQLKGRIARIARGHRTAASALVAVFAATLLLAACTFTGAVTGTSAVTQTGASGTSETSADGTESADTALPADYAEDASVSLKDLAPFTPAVLDGFSVPGTPEFITETLTIGGCEVGFCRDGNGDVWAGYRKSDGGICPFQQIYWFSDDASNADINKIEPFTDLLGYDGFSVSYQSDENCDPYYDGLTGSIYNARRYFFFDSDGELCFLAQALGDIHVDDWDGDGADELFWTGYGPAMGALYFERDGKLYEAYWVDFVYGPYPAWTSYEFGAYNADTRLLTISGYLENWATAKRFLRFDGDSFVFCRDARTVSDHVMSGIEAPDTVLDEAKHFVSSELKSAKDSSPLCGYNDYRVESLEPAGTLEDFFGKTLEIYNLNYELHALHPENVGLAGGMYLTEDNWVMPDYPYCTYLIFEKKDGALTYLLGIMENDCSPGSELFAGDLRRRMLDYNLLSLTDFSGRELLDFFVDDPDGFKGEIGDLSASEQAEVWDRLAYYKTNGFDRTD